MFRIALRNMSPCAPDMAGITAGCYQRGWCCRANGIRTRATSLKGRQPWPLADRALGVKLLFRGSIGPDEPRSGGYVVSGFCVPLAMRSARAYAAVNVAVIRACCAGLMSAVFWFAW